MHEIYQIGGPFGRPDEIFYSREDALARIMELSPNAKEYEPDHFYAPELRARKIRFKGKTYEVSHYMIFKDYLFDDPDTEVEVEA